MCDRVKEEPKNYRKGLKGGFMGKTDRWGSFSTRMKVPRGRVPVT